MKCVQLPVPLVTGQSIGANYTSPSINVVEVDVCGIQINYTGSSPVGAFSVQASNDNVSFATIPLSVNGTVVTSLAVPASSSPIVLDIITGSLCYLQVVYAFTSGTGTMTIITTKKRLGD